MQRAKCQEQRKVCLPNALGALRTLIHVGFCLCESRGPRHGWVLHDHLSVGSMVDDHSHDSRARPIFQYNRRWCGADRAAFAIGKFIGTIIGGVVIDRMGTRIALVGGPLAGGIASLLAGGAPHRSRAGKRPRSAFGRLFGEHFQSRRAVPCLRPALSVFGGASGDGGGRRH